VVVLLPDSGNMYLSQFLAEEWVREHGHAVEPRPSGLSQPEPTERPA
jgi:cystathionine beta-synthase